MIDKEIHLPFVENAEKSTIEEILHRIDENRQFSIQMLSKLEVLFWMLRSSTALVGY